MKALLNAFKETDATRKGDGNDHGTEGEQFNTFLINRIERIPGI
jgi:hypothetical protein